MNILLLKESNAGEQRVALTPNDIKTLIEKKHHIFVESQAGSAAGFPMMSTPVSVQLYADPQKPIKITMRFSHRKT